ncbi:patatin-like phospholipase family protein [Paraneptunicella aestuarii]|uniref:patatin-like phospholipase family protein n=1 Tax=Paraneptunicella aestuarii TaxID=2831148 RepID=UPI001E2864F2|nr:patatin-like phospholipase family protein [Paraneptunicella aestuarii]UAA39868.1 patatin-like phospholipase family protein [Paraneptunicella aestuarii]
MQNSNVALMLTGGGARAAYQVGVLKAITSLFPRNHHIPFPVLCGTSAGAINATALACYASCYHLGVRKLEWVWKNFSTEQVYVASMSGTLRHMAGNYFSKYQSDDVRNSKGSLLDNRPLRRLLRAMLDFKRIDRNIHTQYLRAISVTVSSYSSHDSVSYFQGQPDQSRWQRQKRRGEPCKLEVDHLLGSAAIPIVFPVVQLGDDYVGDGSIHQLSPLSTPIHLGAEKVLVVGVGQRDKNLRMQPHIFPRSATVAGHLLDTLFADTLDADIERLERINKTLSIMTPEQLKSTELKPIDCMVIKPSQDLTAIARKHYKNLPSGIRTLLKLIGVSEHSESSLPSYLMFEGSFCQELIQLGYKDGMERKEQLKAFLEI